MTKLYFENVSDTMWFGSLSIDSQGREDYTWSASGIVLFGWFIGIQHIYPVVWNEWESIEPGTGRRILHRESTHIKISKYID